MRCFAKVRSSLPSEANQSDIKISGERLTAAIGGVESTYSFDGVYGPDVKTRTLFKEKCEPLLHRVVEGTNVSIVALGITGSGKSYLMNGRNEEPGIAPCMINGLFQVIERMQNKEFFVTVQYLEVMDDSLVDLLNPHTGQLKVRPSPQGGVQIQGLSALVVQDASQLLQYYEQGTRARKMGTTGARAHREKATSIFMLNIEQREPGRSNVGLTSCLTLVDLAGIECSTCNALVTCITALGQGSKTVPYRDSKLSILLQQTFGGNCLTSVFALLSPCGNDNSKTFSLSQPLRQIKHSVAININDTDKIVSNLREQISTLREKVAGDVSNKEDVIALQELVQELQLAKQQTWEERQKLSLKYEQERKTNLANQGILEWVMDSKLRDQQQIQEKINHLQKEKQQLSEEFSKKRTQVMELKEQLQKHIADFSRITESDKVSDSERKSRVDAIHKLKERLKEASDNQKALKLSLQNVVERLRSERTESSSKVVATKGSLSMEWLIEAEERQRMESENSAMVADELERMKLEIEHEKADIKLKIVDGKTYSAHEYAELEMKITELQHEKPVTSLEIQTLKQEKAKLQEAVEEMHRQHTVELEKQQMQHFQTFRNYRETFDKQKLAIEQRYRQLLDDSIQDAVFLSSRNNELVAENDALRLEVATLKDAMSRKVE